jgi:hypothetical protein
MVAESPSEYPEPILANHRDQDSVGYSVAGSTLTRRQYVLSVDSASGRLGPSIE